MASRSNPSSLGLRGIALLRGMPRERLEALARECAWRHAGAGKRIIARAARERDVYFIAAGRVRVTSYSAAGRQVTFRDFGAGEHFGELSAIDGRPRPADVVALRDSLLAALPPEAFARLLATEPTVVGRLLQSLASHIRLLSERVMDLSTLGVPHRLRVELLRLAQDAGVRANRSRIEPAPKHAELAGKISTIREQVTREISGMRRLGLVRREGRALVVRDVARLARAVEEAKSGV